MTHLFNEYIYILWCCAEYSTHGAVLDVMGESKMQKNTPFSTMKEKLKMTK